MPPRCNWRAPCRQFDTAAVRPWFVVRALESLQLRGEQRFRISRLSLDCRIRWAPLNGAASLASACSTLVLAFNFKNPGERLKSQWTILHFYNIYFSNLFKNEKVSIQPCQKHAFKLLLIAHNNVACTQLIYFSLYCIIIYLIKRVILIEQLYFTFKFEVWLDLKIYANFK